MVSPGDIRGQMESALSNIDQILAKAGMKRSDILKLRFFTTDVDGFLANYDVYARWSTSPASGRRRRCLAYKDCCCPS